MHQSRGFHTENNGVSGNLQNPSKDKTIPSKKIIIVGDSLLSNIVSKGLEKNHPHSVNVQSHGGCNSLDIVDHIRPEARKKPDKIILMVGTNDLTNNYIDTIGNLKEAIKQAKEISPGTSLALTSVPIYI